MKTLLSQIQAVCLLSIVFFSVAKAQAQITWITNNGTIKITGGCPNNPGALVIPETINGLPVTSIGTEAFDGCTNLIGITIPNSVRSIESYAFSRCSSLTKVAIPDRVTSMGFYAFFSSTRLSELELSESLATIPNGAFAHCPLRSVTIPASVSLIMRIGPYSLGAFSGCPLTTVYFKGNHPTVSGGAFTSTSMTAYYLPGTTGWGPTLAGRPTAFWVLPEPVILKFPPGVVLQTNGLGFRISWATNSPVVVEATTNLSAPDWSPVSTNALVDGWVDFRDPAWVDHGQRFYRVRRP